MTLGGKTCLTTKLQTISHDLMGNRTPSVCDVCNQPADETMIRLPECNHYVHLRCSETCQACENNKIIAHLVLIVGMIMFIGALIGYAVGKKHSGCAEIAPLVDRLQEDALRLEKAAQAACWRAERRTAIAEALERTIRVLNEETGRIENQAGFIANAAPSRS